MKISNKGVNIIKYFEKFSAKAYRALKTEKYLTIGYGHYGRDVAPSDTITLAEAENLLKYDIQTFEVPINELNIELEQHQYDALVSLVYNIGLDAFKKSTFRKKLLAKDFDSAPIEFSKWVYSGGSFSNGLAKRRFAEAKLFCGAAWEDIKSLVESKKNFSQKDIREISYNG